MVIAPAALPRTSFQVSTHCFFASLSDGPSHGPQRMDASRSSQRLGSAHSWASTQVRPFSQEATDFGQSRFGHPDLTSFGQSNFGQSILGHLGFGPANFGQNQCWPKPMSANPFLANPFGSGCVCVCHGKAQRVGPKPRKSRAPKGGAPKGGALKGGGPKISRFFPSPAPNLRSLCLSLGVCSWNFDGVFEGWDP